MEFTEKLRSLRKATGLSQTEVAKHIGVSSVRIANIETGKKAPTTDLLKKMSKLYGCDAQELIASMPDKNYNRDNCIEKMLIEFVGNLPSATKRRLLKALIDI